MKDPWLEVGLHFSQDNKFIVKHYLLYPVCHIFQLIRGLLLALIGPVNNEERTGNELEHEKGSNEGEWISMTGYGLESE